MSIELKLEYQDQESNSQILSLAPSADTKQASKIHESQVLLRGTELVIPGPAPSAVISYKTHKIQMFSLGAQLVDPAFYTIGVFV